MTANLRIQNLTVDAHDPGSIATFSQEALGWRRSGEERGLVVLEPPAASPEEPVSPDLLFLRVPEEKSVKNRLHLDLRPRDQAGGGGTSRVARCETGLYWPGRRRHLSRARRPEEKRVLRAQFPRGLTGPQRGRLGSRGNRGVV